MILGQYCCNIMAGPEKGCDISTLDTNVALIASVQGTFISSEPLEIKFYPAIYVEEELTLDEGSFTANLKIIGLEEILDQITVKPLYPSLIQISSPDRSLKSTAVYKIKLLDFYWKMDELEDPMTVEVTSKLTNQIHKVHVRPQGMVCPRGAYSQLFGLFYGYRHTITIIVSMIIIFLLTFYGKYILDYFTDIIS